MKKTIITLMISAGLLISAQVKAETIKATECTVNTQEDDAGSPHPRSLRGSLLYGYNRQGTGRACTEVIKFYAGVDFKIKPQAPLVIDNENDVDSDGDGNNLLITKGDANSVTIDGTDPSYSEDNCVVDVKNNKVKISGLTIKAKKRDKALCGQDLASGSNVTIIANDDQCTIGTTCCDEHAKFASSTTDCTTNDNKPGTCSGSSATCVANPPATVCTAADVCCDPTQNGGAGAWKTSGSCTTSDNQQGTCDANHHCNANTATVCTAADGDCCVTTDAAHPEGKWKSDGDQCDDGNAATTNDVCTNHVCAGTAPQCDHTTDLCCTAQDQYAAAGTDCTDASNAAGTCDGMSTTCTPIPVVCTSTDACCDTSVAGGQWKSDGTQCDDGNAATTNDVCTNHACAGSPATNGGGGTVNPGGGNTPGGSSGTPDGSNTTPIDIGGNSGGGCMLSGSSSLAGLWTLLLGMLPVLGIRRKKQINPA